MPSPSPATSITPGVYVVLILSCAFYARPASTLQKPRLIFWLTYLLRLYAVYRLLIAFTSAVFRPKLTWEQEQNNICYRCICSHINPQEQVRGHRTVSYLLPGTSYASVSYTRELPYFRCMPAARHRDSTPDSRRVCLCSWLPWGSYGAGSPTAVVFSRELVSCGNGGTLSRSWVYTRGHVSSVCTLGLFTCAPSSYRGIIVRLKAGKRSKFRTYFYFIWLSDFPGTPAHLSYHGL